MNGYAREGAPAGGADPGRGAGRRRSSWWQAMAIGALLLPLAGGCLFAPRDPEPPAGNEVVYPPASEPAVVMENLDKALQARDAVGYLNMISPNFRYIPDSEAASQYPAVDWDNWDQAQEELFITALFNNVEAVESALRDVVIFAEPASGTTVEWEFIYALQVTSPGAAQPTPYRGRAFFKLALEGTFWALAEWRDVQGEADPVSGATLPTSGNLRGAITAGGG